MEKVINNKYVKILLNVLLIISMLSFSFIFSVSINAYAVHKVELINIGLTFILGIYLIIKRFVNKNLVNTTRFEKLVALILTISLMNEIRYTYDISKASIDIVNFLNNYHLLRITKIFTKIMALFFIFLMFLYLIRTIGRFIIKIIKSMDKEEKSFVHKYLCTLILLIILMYISIYVH